MKLVFLFGSAAEPGRASVRDVDDFTDFALAVRRWLEGRTD